MAHGFQDRVATLVVLSRKVLSWRVSNTMTPGFCVEASTNNSESARDSCVFYPEYTQIFSLEFDPRSRVWNTRLDEKVYLILFSILDAVGMA